ncbi:hypothetical protein T09_1877, partial [Trichinella sp. T9]
MEWFDTKFFPLPLKWKLQAALTSCRNLQNDSAEQEKPLRDCPSQIFNRPDFYHNLFIVSWITR